MDKLKTLGGYVLARFEEPSTWAASGVGAIAIHQVLPGMAGNVVLGVVAAAAAALAFFLPEKKA